MLLGGGGEGIRLTSRALALSGRGGDGAETDRGDSGQHLVDLHLDGCECRSLDE